MPQLSMQQLLRKHRDYPLNDFGCSAFALQGCGPASPTQTNSGLNPEPALNQRMILLPGRSVCQVMQEPRPVLVVWSDAVRPDAVTGSGDIPADKIRNCSRQ